MALSCLAYGNPPDALLPQPKAHPSGNTFCAYMGYVVDLSLTDFQASLLDLGRNSLEKSFLDIFIKAVDLWNQTTFRSSVHTSFHWKGFLGPNISKQKEHSHHKGYSSSNRETRATVFQVLIVCIAPDKCYLLYCKSLVSFIQSNFGFYLGFFLVNRSFRVLIPISAGADLAVSYQWFGSERPPKHHNKQSYFKAVMPCAQLFSVQEVPSGGACRLWSYPFLRVM